MGIAGLLAWGWAAWALFKSIRRGFRAENGNGRGILLRVGLTAAIVAFALNAMMHSYIGNYEIHYFLWLLIGLLFCLSRADEDTPPSERAPRVRRRRIAAAAVGLVLVGTVNVWNSTHALSLRSQTEKRGLIQDFGLYAREKTADGRDFRWTREYGALPVTIDRPVLRLPLQAAHPDISERPVTVRIYLVQGLFESKRLLRTVTIADNDWRTVDLPVAEENGEKGIIFLEVDRTWNPEKTVGARDARNLGVAVGKIG